MQNPVRAARQQLGLSVRQLAIKAGLDAARVSQVERGAAKGIGPKLLAFFTMMGFDPDVLSSQYQAWRSLQAS